MSICIAKSRYDTHVMSVSELARRLNLPASRMRKVIGDGVIRPCGRVGHSSVVAITDDELETLRVHLASQTGADSRCDIVT